MIFSMLRAAVRPFGGSEMYLCITDVKIHFELMWPLIAGGLGGLLLW